MSDTPPPAPIPPWLVLLLIAVVLVGTGRIADGNPDKASKRHDRMERRMDAERDR